MTGHTTDRRAIDRMETDGRGPARPDADGTAADGPGVTRRHLLSGAGALGLVGITGCLDDVTEHESRAYGVSESTASDAGYELSSVDRVVIEEPVGIGPLEETVVATNHVVEYEKTLDMGPLGEQRGGVFVTFSTPQVSVFGREFNPVADMDAEELVELVQDGYEGLSEIERDEDDEVEVLGETVSRTRFEAEATFDGSSVDVDLHVTEAAATDEDLVVTVGVYPRQLRSMEEEHTIAMMEGVDVDAVDAAEAESGEASTDDGDGSEGDGDSGDDDEDDTDDTSGEEGGDDEDSEDGGDDEDDDGLLG
ncbi:DUF6517 family protein [Halorubrum sp. DTA98]|uniref:DUF6517 family protein n=1 Tax=Halorubrum sp. DTA98 TaxID=3402163 RepID=UPI003AAD61DA